MRLRVLGQTELWRGTEQVELGPAKQRAVIAGLAMSRGRPLSLDAVADLLTETPSPFGLIRHLRPALQMSETPPHWSLPPSGPRSGRRCARCWTRRTVRSS